MADTNVLEPNQDSQATVLIVEDEPELLSLFQGLLETSFTVLIAHDAKEARSVVHRHQGSIQLVVSDVTHPGMSGISLAADLRRFHPSMRILFLSGHPAEMLDLQDANFLQKPFRMAAF